MTTSDRARWASVLRRKAGIPFVYAVSTTGVFCRPDCAARRPLRRNVRFFERAADALREGYRPCKRCGPDPRVARLCGFLQAHAAERLPLGRLAELAGLSAAHLQRVFVRATGVSPRAFVRACRLARFRAGLRRGRVLDALNEAGFGSTSRAHGALGMSPGTYRRGGRGEEIRWAQARSPLGRVLAASTSRGVCWVSLGGTAAELAREFPKARIRKDAGALGASMREILRRLEGRAPRADLPLDVKATAFQARVWEELARIPRGKTRTYGELARRLGRPRAARAVGRAVGSNRVALLLPCHRVVRGDGGVGGYRWGAERKRRLLEREGAR